MESGGDEGYHPLKFNANPVVFEPLSRNRSIFFDETNRQIFVVSDDGNVTVIGSDGQKDIELRLDPNDVQELSSIKFNGPCDILALQRTENVIQFRNFTNCQLGGEFIQRCLAKNARIFGFVWTNSKELVFVTDTDIEFYQVIPDKKQVKSLKTFNINVNWFVYQPSSMILLLSTGTVGNVFQTFQFRSTSMYKLSKFEVDWFAKPKPTKLSLFERDVALATIYGKTRLLVLRHHPVSNDQTKALILVYTFERDGPPKKTHVLNLGLTGRFAINVADDLVIVHHQPSQTSLMFDINMPGSPSENQDSMLNFSPVVPPYPIKPFILPDNTPCELYSVNWVVFQPNIIIDAKLGRLWYLQIDLEALSNMMSNKVQLIDFLLMRKNSKPVVCKVISDVISGNISLNVETQSFNQLGNSAFLFNKLNQIYKSRIEKQAQDRSRNSSSHPYVSKGQMFIEQSDMQNMVFAQLDCDESNGTEYQGTRKMDNDMLIAIIFEYIHSLTDNDIPVQHSLYELLIEKLVAERKFFLLHQLIQYQVFADSKPLACLLLSLSPQYPHAEQLALDMFKRLNTASEQIIDVFLSKHQVFKALKFIERQSALSIDNLSARKYLEVAKLSGDSQLYYNVFRFFELRNLRLRGSAEFVSGEGCEEFVETLKEMYGVTTTMPS